MSATFEEHSDRHVWTLHDHRVTQLVVEMGAARLVTWTLHASLDVRLGAAFTLRQADGVERATDPDEPEQLAEAAGALHQVADEIARARRPERAD